MKKLLQYAATLVLLAFVAACAQAGPHNDDSAQALGRLADECLSGLKREFPVGGKRLPTGETVYGIVYKANIGYSQTTQRGAVLNALMGPEVTEGQTLCYLGVDVNGTSAIGFPDSGEAYYFSSNAFAQGVQEFFETSFRGYSANQGKAKVDSYTLISRYYLAAPLGGHKEFAAVNWSAAILAGAAVTAPAHAVPNMPSTPALAGASSASSAPTATVVAPAGSAASSESASFAVAGGYSPAAVTQALVNKGLATFMAQNAFAYPKAQALFMEWAVACADADSAALEGVNTKLGRLNAGEKSEFAAKVKALMEAL